MFGVFAARRLAGEWRAQAPPGGRAAGPLSWAWGDTCRPLPAAPRRAGKQRAAHARGAGRGAGRECARRGLKRSGRSDTGPEQPGNSLGTAPRTLRGTAPPHGAGITPRTRAEQCRAGHGAGRCPSHTHGPACAPHTHTAWALPSQPRSGWTAPPGRARPDRRPRAVPAWPLAEEARGPEINVRSPRVQGALSRPCRAEAISAGTDGGSPAREPSQKRSLLLSIAQAVPS